MQAVQVRASQTDGKGYGQRAGVEEMGGVLMEVFALPVCGRTSRLERKRLGVPQLE